MIIKKQYFKIIERNRHRCEYLITSWNLLGFIPIYISEKLVKEFNC